MTASGPGSDPGSVVTMSLACEFSISASIILPLDRGDRSGKHAGVDDVGGRDPAMHEIVRQVHHFAEAMIHHRQAAVGAEHAQPVRHVVQRRIELARKRRFAFACHDRAHEYFVQIGRELHHRQKKRGAHHRHRDVIGRAAQRQRDHGRTELKHGLQMKYRWPPVGPPRSSRHDPGGDGKADHVDDGIVAAQQGDGAPYADRSRLDQRTDLIAPLPLRGFFGSQRRFARQESMQIECPDGSGQDQKRDACPGESLSGLQRGQGCREGHEDDARQQRTRSFEQRIDRCRRAGLRRNLLVGPSAPSCELHFGDTRPVRVAYLLPVADEVFLSEHRYQDVVCRLARLKLCQINQQARQGLPVRRRPAATL